MNTLRILLVVLGAVLPALGASAQSTHWSFTPPVRPRIPAIRNPKSDIRNPIDLFLTKRLNSAGLSLSKPADRRTLLRRVTFDLTGLPPTPQETAAFLSDRSPRAYERVVDRLLKSPHLGERWAQHWLDVVRFAESNGYEHDLDRPQAWRYRDWVVKALNEDMPYDRFVQMQVAGDLLKPGDFDSRVATGFLRAGPFHITGGNLDPKEMRQEWLTEAVASIGNGVLGLTIGCARCHDHKIDPVPQTEYYRLQAFFSATANEDQFQATPEERKKYDAAVEANKERRKPIEAQIAAIEKPYREKLRAEKIEKLPAEYRAALAVPADKRTAEQKKLAADIAATINVSWDEVVEALSVDDRAKRAGMRQQIFAIERELPTQLPEAKGVGDAYPAPAMRLLVRGEVHKPGEEVSPGYPSCLSKIGPIRPIRPIRPISDRADLARWLTSPENPLTSRVMVNRLWHYLFGRGLVPTPNDYGKKGQPPSHPELLDWLAVTLQTGDGGRMTAKIQDPKSKIQNQPWSLKRMIRLMVVSDAYRQASDYDARKAAVDPENRLLWRMNRKRLDAEALRDSVLAVAGTLNPELGGPSVRVPLEPEVYDTIFTEYEPDNLWETTRDAKQHTRRSLYLFRKRNVRLPMLAVFDQPDLMTSCAARGQTVHALQALTLINGELMRQQSFALAGRLFAESPRSERARIESLFTLAFGRPPTSRELRSTEAFLKAQTTLARTNPTKLDGIPAGVDPAAYRATADLCLATLNRNEFLYVR